MKWIKHRRHRSDFKNVYLQTCKPLIGLRPAVLFLLLFHDQSTVIDLWLLSWKEKLSPSKWTTSQNNCGNLFHNFLYWLVGLSSLLLYILLWLLWTVAYIYHRKCNTSNFRSTIHRKHFAEFSTYCRWKLKVHGKFNIEND